MKKQDLIIKKKLKKEIISKEEKIKELEKRIGILNNYLDWIPDTLVDCNSCHRVFDSHEAGYWCQKCAMPYCNYKECFSKSCDECGLKDIGDKESWPPLGDICHNCLKSKGYSILTCQDCDFTLCQNCQKSKDIKFYHNIYTNNSEDYICQKCYNNLDWEL